MLIGIGHSLSLICQPTPEDIQLYIIIIIREFLGGADTGVRETTCEECDLKNQNPVALRKTPNHVLRTQRLALKETPSHVLKTQRLTLKETPSHVLKTRRLTLRETRSHVLKTQRLTSKETPSHELKTQTEIKASLTLAVTIN